MLADAALQHRQSRSRLTNAVPDPASDEVIIRRGYSGSTGRGGG